MNTIAARIPTAFTLAVALLLAGCASTAPPPEPEGQSLDEPTVSVRGLGEHFDTAQGPAKLIRVQDEFRLILCVKEGQITGCYADMGHLPRSADLTTWYEIESAPGLKLAMLTPEQVVVVQEPVRKVTVDQQEN